VSAAPQELDLIGRKNRVEKAVTPEKPKPKLVPRTITLSIDYVDPDTGDELHADVKSSILTGDERRIRDSLMADLTGGPVSMLAAVAQSRLLAMATLTISLKRPPAWLLRWMSEDDVLLGSIYKEVERHETRYFQRHVGTGDAAEGGPIVVVTSTLPADDPTK
jgi:hypothetical protein